MRKIWAPYSRRSHTVTLVHLSVEDGPFTPHIWTKENKDSSRKPSVFPPRISSCCWKQSRSDQTQISLFFSSESSFVEVVASPAVALLPIYIYILKKKKEAKTGFFSGTSAVMCLSLHRRPWRFLEVRCSIFRTELLYLSCSWALAWENEAGNNISEYTLNPTSGGVIMTFMFCVKTWIRPFVQNTHCSRRLQ